MNKLIFLLQGVKYMLEIERRGHCNMKTPKGKKIIREKFPKKRRINL